MARTLTHIVNHAPAIFDRAEKASKAGQGVVSLILSATAVDAFIYDLHAWFGQAAEHKKTCPGVPGGLLRREQPCNFHLWHTFSDREFKVWQEIDPILNSKRGGRVLDALAVLNKHACDEKHWSEDESPYLNYKRLREIRNALVHIRGEVLVAEHGSPDVVREGYPEEVLLLIREGIIKSGDVMTSWIDLLDTETFGRWCVNAAANFMARVIDSLPDDKLSQMFGKQAGLF